LLESVPVQAWILLIIGIWAINPARNLWDHVSHAPNRRDITLPPEDLAWRTGTNLFRSAASLLVLGGVAIFVFTPTAEEFARSDFLVPALFGTFGILGLLSNIRGLREGESEPLVKGSSRSYRHDDEPAKYWLSVSWNWILVVGLLVGAVATGRDAMEPRCQYDEATDELPRSLRICADLIADAAGEPEQAGLLAERGRIYDLTGSRELALADYNRATVLDSENPYLRYDRGFLLLRMNRLPQAIEDLDVAIELNPDHNDAYLKRGVAYLRIGDLPAAIADFTVLADREPENPYAYANRGAAYAGLGRVEEARADFARVDRESELWRVVLQGRALLALREKDYEQVVSLLTDAIALNPEDPWSYRSRADAYWEMGELDLARDDDDTAWELEQKLYPERIPVLIETKEIPRGD